MRTSEDLAWMDDLSLRVKRPNRARFLTLEGWLLLGSAAVSIGACLGALHLAGAL